jgi:hypothetical protein
LWPPPLLSWALPPEAKRRVASVRGLIALHLQLDSLCNVTGAEPSSHVVGSLRHGDPTEPSEERVDVKRTPLSQAAIHFRRQCQLASLGMSSVKGDVNAHVTSKILFQRPVRQPIMTRYDK